MAQIYGGYFLGLFLFLLFCLDCKVWTRAKINYPFIFEFDSRHNLDWRQLAEVSNLALGKTRTHSGDSFHACCSSC